jgi:hypothetical protein
MASRLAEQYPQDQHSLPVEPTNADYAAFIGKHRADFEAAGLIEADEFGQSRLTPAGKAALSNRSFTELAARVDRRFGRFGRPIIAAIRSLQNLRIDRSLLLKFKSHSKN